MDGDVAVLLAREGRDAVEMAVERGGVVVRVARLGAHGAREEGVAARGVDDVARAEGVHGAVLRPRRDAMPFLRVERDVEHAHAFPRIRTGGARAAEQHLVELAAADLVGVGVVLVEPRGEGEGGVPAVFVRDEARARLVHADRRDLLVQPQAFEDPQVQRQQALPDVEAGMVVLLQQHDAAALLGEQRRGGGSGRPAADDQHVAKGLAGEGGGVERHGA